MTPSNNGDYDSKQLKAIRIRCVVCDRLWDCTDPTTVVCLECREGRWQGMPDDD